MNDTHPPLIPAPSSSPRGRCRSVRLSVEGSTVLGLAALLAVACKATVHEPAPPASSVVAPAAEGMPPPVAEREWEDLLPPATLAGFRRVPLDPLAAKTVWQIRPDGVLFIDGLGAKEMLLTERAFEDGRLLVEWRFVPAAAVAPDTAPGYNGGVYVRTPADGKTWVQLQVALADEPPVVGDLIAQVPGQAERLDVFQPAPVAAPSVGDWVQYDIIMRGPRIELRVDGQTSVSWGDCPMLTGHVGLQAEGAAIEVRTLKFQPL